MKPAVVLTSGSSSFWFPTRGSSVAADVDSLFYYILVVSAFFFLLIAGLLVYFVIRYRWQRARKPEESRSHNLPLELTWSIIPLVIVGSIFYLGFTTYLNMRSAYANAEEIQVTGQKWKWFFTYPNGHVDEDLHAPLDRPVRLVMRSEDVIHSLFIPAFRVKQDVVPGQYTVAWFKALEAGSFPLYCAEYCGTQHSGMVAQVVVHEPGGYEKWLGEAAALALTASPTEAGERLYRIRACGQCHSVNGQAGIGPTFKGSFGKERPLADGTTVLMDENYVRESIVNPQAKVAAGFQPVMPTYQGKLNDQEISAIIAFLKTLKD